MALNESGFTPAHGCGFSGVTAGAGSFSVDNRQILQVFGLTENELLRSFLIPVQTIS